jgi:hypothetical protein
MDDLRGRTLTCVLVLTEPVHICRSGVPRPPAPKVDHPAPRCAGRPCGHVCQLRWPPVTLRRLGCLAHLARWWHDLCVPKSSRAEVGGPIRTGTPAAQRGPADPERYRLDLGSAHRRAMGAPACKALQAVRAGAASRSQSRSEAVQRPQSFGPVRSGASQIGSPAGSPARERAFGAGLAADRHAS